MRSVPSARARVSIVVAVVAAVASACSSGGDRARRATATSTTSTTTSTAGPGPAPSPAAIPEPSGLDASVKLTQVAELTGTTAMALRPGDGTWYVTEQVGRVRAIRDGLVDPAPVLDITRRVASGGERGLLGVTFSRDGSRLYVDFTNSQGDTRVEEYTMRGSVADPASRRELLAIDQPQPNHNGGEVTVGPDGMLWIATGDGGAGGDRGPGHAPGGNAQSLDTLLGKLLRIDPTPSAGRAYSIPRDNPFVSGGGRPEIWAYGLRNPWRFSFDRATGDLWIGDVGQGEWEEIDRLPAGSGAGTNFGWNRLEGTHEYAGRAPAGAVPPVFEYSHGTDGGSCAVTGGFVYRGTRIPGLVGAYLFVDNCAGHVRALRVHDGRVTVQRDLGLRLGSVSSFGQDARGELYLLSQRDGLYGLDPSE
ncbi:MAG TPA: PQQ-dependent sugar dehydrogenase [Acidimicrobiia bacterium]|nr:PQQ-dependent sugar dehydrogenase [Acidimicrobiia bacterium]